MAIKKIIKEILGDNNCYRISTFKKRINTKRYSFFDSIVEVYDSQEELFKNVKFKNYYEGSFLSYNIDVRKIYRKVGKRKIENLMIDYSKVLDFSLEDLKERNEVNINILNSIEELLNTQINNTKNKKIINSLNGIKNRKANSFQDALQRILFYNQLLWQSFQQLNGLGRLDYLLINYYKSDIKKGIKASELEDILREFLVILHRDYYYKSGTSLSGDTGQIIILGGKDNKYESYYNELSYLFIRLIKELQLPDPKILLRVDKNTPRDLIELSLKCIETGIGCPLFCNDDIVIPTLINYGYDKKDVWNYGTAACWEPFITGKSFDMNNLKSIVFIKPLTMLLENEVLDKYKNFDNLMNDFKKYTYIYLDDFIDSINKIKFEENPLLSIFTDNCGKTNKDISAGGAKYNNYGFTGVSLPNLVNSLLNIKKLVYDEKKYTLTELNNIRLNNYINSQALNNIKNTNLMFGIDDVAVINLTNKITSIFSDYFNNKINPLGGKYKFGFSAPSYIWDAEKCPASFDGRKNGEPFAVHISNDKSNSYTELVNFAANLDYSNNRFNGNVIDYFVSPNFINDNFDKFVDFLIVSIKKGFFEMQMNVVSSKKLIAAKKNPKEFPNLIVRVWGFSAYFNDLPEEYKDYLIERAIKNENINN